MEWLCSIPMSSNTIRVRIRGVYSTALTKFFIDKGFEITQPSPSICSRFGLDNPSYLSPHIDIKAKGSGALIECVQRLTPQLKELLLGNFEDIVLRQHIMIKNSVWKGIITKKTKEGYLVKYSIRGEGLLPYSEAKHEYREGDLVLVEVRGYDKKNDRILLTDTISVPGDFVVLVQKEIIKVSRKIRGSKKVDLMDLGNILRPPGWGAIFRTSAMYASVEEISEEIERLKSNAEELIKIAEKAPACTQIREGINIILAYFPMKTKQAFDRIRSKVVPTLKRHHWLKALGRVTSFLVDFVEEYFLGDSKHDSETISKYVMEYVRKTILPKPGDIIRILHIKPTMRRVILGPAKIIDKREVNGSIEYVLFRKFKPGGYYDGIQAPKETGDYGITIAREGDSKLVTAYFDMNSELKGIYVNINSPIEIYPNSIRYVDLEIDVVRTTNGEIMILDRQKLEQHAEQGLIPKGLLEFAQKKASEYKRWLEERGVGEILGECERLREVIAEEITS